MSDQSPIDPKRIEFRVICRYRNGTELTWKTTDHLEDALRYIDRLEPRFRNQCEWLVYEVAIAEFARIVHRVTQPPDS